MTLEEKIAMAQTIRSRDRFGPVSPEAVSYTHLDVYKRQPFVW